MATAWLTWSLGFLGFETEHPDLCMSYTRKDYAEIFQSHFDDGQAILPNRGWFFPMRASYRFPFQQEQHSLTVIGPSERYDRTFRETLDNILDVSYLDLRSLLRISVYIIGTVY